MKKEFLTAVTFVIVFCGYILAQSEYARQVAESYRESPIYRHYVTSGDMLVNQPDHVVFIPKQEPMVLGDRYNDHFQVIARGTFSRRISTSETYKRSKSS